MSYSGTPESRTASTDLVLDIKALTAVVLSGGGPALALVGVAVTSVGYGVWRVAEGVTANASFASYAIGIFFIIAVLPLLLAAAIVGRR